ncbi:MAG: phosphoglycolate phosphatase [Blastocatellia bacterium]|jgi:phosphoglycolate phosphatase|nr:phosphoglycolate phosphatase [Blastocatellia bacterium]
MTKPPTITKPSRIRNVLFDLDGTLTDPREGITRCLQYALEKLSAEVPSQSALEAYIGPPLRSTFKALLAAPDAARVEAAVGFYRERFTLAGLFENELYAGVPLMLEDLRGAGFRLFVATSKAAVFAEKIIAHFRLSQFFDGVYGATLDGRYDDKADLLRHLLAAEALKASETVMVGDREHDIIAARHNRIHALGVTYGYGSRAELTAAGAAWLCDSPGDINAALLAAMTDS